MATNDPATSLPASGGPPRDRTLTSLKWALLVTVVVTVGILIYGTFSTYQMAPKRPDRFVTRAGQTVMTGRDIVQGQAAFQEADLMDYGTLYGMGSYYGEDYTASFLTALGRHIEDAIARQAHGRSYAQLTAGQQYAVRQRMQEQLHGIALQDSVVVLPDAVAKAVGQVRAQTVRELLHNNFAAGWTKADSLNPEKARRLSDFLVYSAFTTIARRPGTDYSYTNNWPYQPTMGNTPTTGTFLWTWVSVAWVLFGIGAVVYVFYRYIHGPDNEPREVLLKG
ncbi:MAG TPA: nitric oxide reductase, partial [Gammaproteobacteria bacterium]|nr:nitric oxide reductase [Gammaproteobacteria bacterium]